MELGKIALCVGLIFVLLGVGLFVAVLEGWISLPNGDGDGDGDGWPPLPVLIPVISQHFTGQPVAGVIVTCSSDIDGTQSVTTIGNDPTTAPHLSLRPTISYTFFASITIDGLYSSITKVITMPSDLNTQYEVYIEITLYYPVLKIDKLELRIW